jgi:hypothetical protein
MSPVFLGSAAITARLLRATVRLAATLTLRAWRVLYVRSGARRLHVRLRVWGFHTHLRTRRFGVRLRMRRLRVRLGAWLPAAAELLMRRG